VTDREAKDLRGEPRGGSSEEARAQARIAELLDGPAGAAAAGTGDGLRRPPGAADGSHRHQRSGARAHHQARHHSHHHSHRHRRRPTPRTAKLQWWHVVLVIVVGLLVTWVVVSIASSPVGPAGR
jgi:hypothetical protein